MLKQCLTLLKHSKTVVNTVWLKSEPCELISLSFFSWTRCELWARDQEPCELISLSNAFCAVSKSSRALLAYLSLSRTRCELWARGQEPCELISLSLSNAFWAVSKSSRAFWAISLSHVSFELRDWLTRSLLGSPRRGSVAALSATQCQII